MKRLSSTVGLPCVDSVKNSNDTANTPWNESAPPTPGGHPGPRKKRGNNRHGNKGTQKCQQCRASKDACEFDKETPDQPCERCLRRKKPCGPKLFMKEEKEMAGRTPLPSTPISAHDHLEKWSIAEGLLQKVAVRVAPDVASEQLILKLLQEIGEALTREKQVENRNLIEVITQLYLLVVGASPPEQDGTIMPMDSPPQLVMPVEPQLPFPEDAMTFTQPRHAGHSRAHSPFFPQTVDPRALFHPHTVSPSFTPSPMVLPADTNYSYAIQPSLPYSSTPQYPSVDTGAPRIQSEIQNTSWPMQYDLNTQFPTGEYNNYGDNHFYDAMYLG